MVGETIKQYKILQKLGEGRLGSVYKAQDQNLDRLVTLKFLMPEFAGDNTAQARLKREAKAASAIDHPNIATFYGMDTSEDGRAFIAFAFYDGITLQERLKGGPLPLAEALDTACQVARGLSQVHQKGIVHRNIKPQNIMITSEGVVKILDFGLAKFSAQTSHLTVVGTVLGTPRYMSPEQLGGKAIDHRTDIWSLGVLLYAMLAGRPPFESKNLVTLVSMIMEKDAAPISQQRSDAPLELEEILQKALAKKPEDRYQQISEMLEELEAVHRKVAPRAPVARITSDPSPTSSDPDSEQVFGMAYVLFTDIVGYSKLPTDTQVRSVRELSVLVESTRAYKRATLNEQLILIPTGDGIALVFFDSPVSPVECAVEISKGLKDHPVIKLRMGIHAGPVYHTVDINKAKNVAGGGINFAQRVMDCGGGGHILVSKAIADVLYELSEWRSSLHDLGVHQVKHGVSINVFNLYSEEFGNSEIPAACAVKPSAPPPKKPSFFQRLISRRST